MSDATIHLRARFDGQALILKEPADLPIGVILDLWTSPDVGKRTPELGTAAGKVKMAEDFDATPDEFKGYF